MTTNKTNIQNQSKSRENIMGTMPIPKLLLTISLPIAISMLIQALYNIVDSIFVAQIGEDALTAVSLTYPIQLLIIAVAVGTSVGMNAMLSRYLGSKEISYANGIAKNAIFLSTLNGAVFAIIGIFFSKFFFTMQTDNELIITYGSQYMPIVTILSIGIFCQITFERCLQATGLSFYSMISQGIGAIINIILDPILIFGLFGLPRLEVAGAAIATVVGQLTGAILGFIFVRKHAKVLDINMSGFRPDRRFIKQIYQIGIPAIIMQSIASIMAFAMNSMLLMFSTTATAVFGVYFKLQSFIFMPVYGINNGLIPIIGYNYGARNKKRIMDSFRLAGIVSCIIMIIGTFIFLLFSTPLLQMFDASDEMLEIGTTALRIISISFPIAGYSIVCCSIYQALGNSVYSLIISATRQLIFLIPIAYLFTLLGDLSVVWYAFPISEFISLLICIYLTQRIKKEIILKL